MRPDEAQMEDGRPTPPTGSAIAEFFRARWRGEAPFGLLFWRDMVVTGTAVNVAATLLAVALLGAGTSLPLVLTVHFLPLPYNIFLFVAIWRSAKRAAGWAAHAAPLAAAAWLVLAAVI